MYFFLLPPFLFKLAGNRRPKCHVERVADKSRGWLTRTWETGGDLLGSDIAGLLRMWLFACRCGLSKFFILNHGRDGYATGSSLAIDLWGDGWVASNRSPFISLG